MAEALRASGAVDDLLAQIDTDEVTLTGEGGLLPGLIKLALEPGHETAMARSPRSRA